jgi:Ni/Co efflux regulator RcnB
MSSQNGNSGAANNYANEMGKAAKEMAEQLEKADELRNEKRDRERELEERREREAREREREEKKERDRKDIENIRAYELKKYTLKYGPPK